MAGTLVESPGQGVTVVSGCRMRNAQAPASLLEQILHLFALAWLLPFTDAEQSLECARTYFGDDETGHC